MNKTALISIFCLTIFLNACGAGDNVRGEKTNASATATGVAACDEYFVKVEKLLGNPNVPPATREAYRKAGEQNRAAWKQATVSPQGETQQETSCRAALDALEPALEQYGK